MLQNLTNRDFLAQFVQKLCMCEHKCGFFNEARSISVMGRNETLGGERHLGWIGIRLRNCAASSTKILPKFSMFTLKFYEGF